MKDDKKEGEAGQEKEGELTLQHSCSKDLCTEMDFVTKWLELRK